MSEALDRATYPVVVLGAYGVFVAAQAAVSPTLSPTLAGYVAVAIAALAILVLEQVRPYRSTWKPKTESIISDGLFLSLVQMLMPVAITLVVTGLASDQIANAGIADRWPHEWPIAAQMISMLVLGDFFRYWMHRVAHRSVRLWQFHAVHHSPKELYWLNVGRFHPLEKAAQMLVDSLPFALLGVSKSVLAAYLVFYAVNGFFQHSNCSVQLGILNHIVAGPELHRWHHSRIIAESDNNFGNNLIIWDTLFGTRLLPPGREVGELGLINRQYPQGFGQQMFTPFQYGLEKSEDQATK